MSHRWDCPDRWDAQREGERAQEYGRSRASNPYESIWPEDGCPEAADAWRSRYRRAEIREEEQREEEAARRRADMRRAYEMAEEAAYYAKVEEAYYAEQERIEEPASVDAVDPSAADPGTLTTRDA